MRIKFIDKETVLCDAFVDQGKYIGNSPVGYHCGGEATTKRQEGYDLCSWCAAHLDRVSFEGGKMSESSSKTETLTAAPTVVYGVG